MSKRIAASIGATIWGVLALQNLAGYLMHRRSPFPLEVALNLLPVFGFLFGLYLAGTTNSSDRKILVTLNLMVAAIYLVGSLFPVFYDGGQLTFAPPPAAS